MIPPVACPLGTLEAAATPGPLKRAAAQEVVPAHESKSPQKDREPTLPAPHHRGSPHDAEVTLRALSIIPVGDWAPHVAAASLSGGAAPRCAAPKVQGVTGEAPATEPLPRPGGSSHAPSAGRGAEERPGRVLELVRGWSVVNHNHFHVAAGVGVLD